MGTVWSRQPPAQYVQPLPGHGSRPTFPTGSP